MAAVEEELVGAGGGAAEEEAAPEASEASAPDDGEGAREPSEPPLESPSLARMSPALRLTTKVDLAAAAAAAGPCEPEKSKRPRRHSAIKS